MTIGTGLVYMLAFQVGKIDLVLSDLVRQDHPDVPAVFLRYWANNEIRGICQDY